MGDLKKALDPVHEGIEIARFHGERVSELFLQRIRGALLYKDGRVKEAEAVLRDTIERSTKLNARSHALSAAIDLADAQRRSFSAFDGRESVRRILSTYDEGFDSPLVKRAQQIADD